MLWCKTIRSSKIEPLSSIAAYAAPWSLGRVTINLNDRDHLAFKLLSLQQDKKLVALIQEAMHDYLQSKGAYNLVISSQASSDVEL